MSRDSQTRFLYVHGMEEDTRVWSPLIEALSRYGRHVAIELPWSSRSESDWVLSDDALEDQLRPVIRSVKASGHAPTVAVAHSFGALATLEYLHHYGTASFDALVLIAPFYRFPDRALDWQKLRALGDHYQQFLQECVSVRLGGNPRDEIVERMAEHVRERIGPVGCIEFLHYYNRSARIDLSAIELPVLVIAGANDYYCSRSDAEEISGAFANARAVVLEGTGHFCMLDVPRMVAGHILSFLGETQCVEPALMEGSL